MTSAFLLLLHRLPQLLRLLPVLLALPCLAGSIQQMERGFDESALTTEFSAARSFSSGVTTPDIPLWTNLDNLATLQYWLALVTDLNGNYGEIVALFGPDAAAALVADGILAPSPVTTGSAPLTSAPSSVPETATMVLLGGGMSLLLGFARLRARAIRQPRTCHATNS